MAMQHIVTSLDRNDISMDCLSVPEGAVFLYKTYIGEQDVVSCVPGLYGFPKQRRLLKSSNNEVVSSRVTDVLHVLSRSIDKILGRPSGRQY